MHACGHDLHMAIGMGTAALLAQNKDRWRGTFIYVGQPAEETVTGAVAMLKEGLYTRFPKPDFALRCSRFEWNSCWEDWLRFRISRSPIQMQSRSPSLAAAAMGPPRKSRSIPSS